MGDKNGTTPPIMFIQNGTQCYVKHSLYDYNSVPKTYVTFTFAYFYVVSIVYLYVFMYLCIYE